MQNVIVYLVGPPGVGKYTVGRLIAERLSATADRIESELMARRP